MNVGRYCKFDLLHLATVDILANIGRDIDQYFCIASDNMLIIKIKDKKNDHNKLRFII